MGKIFIFSSITSSDRLKLIYKTKKMKKIIIMSRLKPLSCAGERR
jgi:hypothetical protein